MATYIKVPDLYDDVPEPNPANDGTPTGYNRVVAVNGDEGRLAGTSGNDRVTISDLRQDRDQIINTGAGDDVFIFHGAASHSPENVSSNNASRVNGIVDFGEGYDGVSLAYQLSDYKFTLRSDGGIKIQYVGDDADIHGAAVTFRNADYFTFRNIDDVTGENYETFTLTTEQLVAQIQSGTLLF